MVSDREGQLAWERRWSGPAALAALAGSALVIASIVVGQTAGSADGTAEALQDVDAHSAATLIASALQAFGVGLMTLPLLYLFRAAAARSEAVRGQLVGVIVAAPLFLAIALLLTGITSVQAASEFVTDEVPRLTAQGVALGSDRADDVASDTIADVGLPRLLATGFGIGGQIGFTFALFYTALHAMRTGLLTRFWGSLGMALGAVSFLFFPIPLLWFLYLGLLIAGSVPGGRQPAWESGEAEPWPTPGERAAQAMENDAGSSPD
ncbi:MAG TPA: hypothetical protein VGB06_05820 [Solirubrobacterales bacterium]